MRYIRYTSYIKKILIYGIIISLLLLFIFLGKDKISGVFAGYGDHYFNGGAYDLKKAAHYYRVATFFDSDAPMLRYQLARVYFVDGKRGDALREADAAVALAPDFGRAYYMRGLINGFSNKLDEAEADFKKILELGEIEPDMGQLEQGGWAVYNDLSWIQFQKGNYADVEETARQGLDVYPQNPWLLNSLGLGLLNLEKKTKAKTIFENALKEAQKLTVEDVRRAYPGNNPAEMEKKRQAIIDQIRFNLTLTSPL